MTKKSILEKIKRLQLTSDSEVLLDMIDEHIDRIEFVKDHVGLRDFIFLSETNAKGFKHSTFAFFDVKVHSTRFYENFLEVNRYLIDEISEIKKRLTAFFSNTNRTLYVGIGFKESVLEQQDMFFAHKLLEEKVVFDTYEAKVRARRFPDWYLAKYPRDIQNEANYLIKLEKIDLYLLDILKNDLLKEIDRAIEKKDKKLFENLCSKLNKIQKELIK